MFLVPVYLALKFKALHCACCSVQITYYNCILNLQFCSEFSLKKSTTKGFKIHPWKNICGRHWVSRMDILIFHRKCMRPNFKNHLWKQRMNNWRRPIWQRSSQWGAEPSLAQGTRWRWLESLTAAAVFAPAQCSHKAPITGLHGGTDGSPSSICP